jgi:hypothetical protein
LPGVAIHLQVPLEVFCARYDIPDSDKEKLAKLEYQPGDNIVVRLEEKYWEREGFTVLRWKGFLAAHEQFLKEVRNGTWAATNDT